MIPAFALKTRRNFVATKKIDLTTWFNDGLKLGATHMIVVCDTFDWEDYPVYVMPDENAKAKAFEYGDTDDRGLPTKENENMQKVMEVYSLSLPLLNQLNEYRAFHFD